MKRNKQNRLAEATSPYLLQHADNPVDWYEWGPEALQLAVTQDKPILLSIGYSACHWCHVMAHESFEDATTAALMNELFINIKVDREERPDLDKIYQTAHQLLAQRAGGWPLTMFLNPQDQLPFFGGTYFPDKARHGLPSFQDLLRQISNAFSEQQQAIGNQNQALRNALQQLAGEQGDQQVPPDDQPIAEALQQLTDQYDQDHGGFGGAPKFPHPTNLQLLLQQTYSIDALRPLGSMALRTLERMCLGGMYDQLGGGFCRYSVDERWMIPHFEKMLYDNGQLLSLYADAWHATGDELFKHTCETLAGWVMREMQSKEGGYYASQDADSEGEEGEYYVWRKDELQQLLPESLYAPLAACYGLNDEANFEGRWHLHAEDRPESLGEKFPHIAADLQAAKNILFAAREQRIHPATDTKILTSWNALMIRSMAHAGRLLDRPEWIDSAERALEQIESTLWREGRLLASYKDGKAHLAAYLDDYAYLIDALLALLQSRWNTRYLHFAITLADVLLAHFQDKEQGGFYFTADDHEQLIQRPKPWSDEAMPSGNGIAAQALLQLGHLLGETRYLDAAENILKAAWPSIRHMPYAHGSLLMAAYAVQHPAELVVIRGEAEEIILWQRQLAREFHPTRTCYAIPANETDLPGAVALRKATGRTVAYKCTGTQCSPPLHEFAEL